MQIICNKLEEKEKTDQILLKNDLNCQLIHQF